MQFISLYADDLLIFLANTDTALEGAQRLLHVFGQYSGLRVNWAKTCLFPRAPAVLNPSQVAGIRWEPYCLPYLGTNIYHTPRICWRVIWARTYADLEAVLGFGVRCRYQ